MYLRFDWTNGNSDFANAQQRISLPPREVRLDEGGMNQDSFSIKVAPHK